MSDERKRVLIGAGGMMAAAALLVSGMGVGGAFPPERLAYSAPTLEAPSIDQIGPREKRNRKLRERQNRKAKRAREAAIVAARKPRRVIRFDPYMAAVNKLTNWQRNQWAGAGYPGSKKREADVVLAFASQRSAERLRRFIAKAA